MTITGTHFVPGSTVRFGLTPSTLVTFVSATQLKARAPPHAAGLVNLSVRTPGGNSAFSSADHYAYGPAQR